MVEVPSEIRSGHLQKTSLERYQEANRSVESFIYAILGMNDFSILSYNNGFDADDSTPSSAEGENGGAIPPIPICLHGFKFN
jgi:hypothetical protein